MRKTSVLLALLLTLVMSLAALSTSAKTPCYRIKISFKGTVLVDKVVGLYCSTPPAVDGNGTTYYVRG